MKILHHILIGLFCIASLVIAYKGKVPAPKPQFYSHKPIEFKCYDCEYFNELVEDCDVKPLEETKGVTTGILFSFSPYDTSDVVGWPVKKEYKGKMISLFELWAKLKNGNCKVR